jgi:murein DD-endopeptidase MepM/ murein hydrolase activator NlpD
MRVCRRFWAVSFVCALLNAITMTVGVGQDDPDAPGVLRPVRALQPDLPAEEPSPGLLPVSVVLGPAPRLAPITRFIRPIDPWVRSGFGWGDVALGEDGEPLCETNREPLDQCDPLGPRPFQHVGFDAQAAPDRSVRAAAAGWVVAARVSFATFIHGSGEGGGVVVLQHDLDGDPGTTDDVLLTVYEHVEPLVAAGDVVQQGDTIARTSEIRGTHLHFGVRRTAFDPGDADLYCGILPPPGTSGCRPCRARPVPLPAFPDRWDDPEELFRTFEWASLFVAGRTGAGDVLETRTGYLAAGWTDAANIGGTHSSDMWFLRLDRAGQILSQSAYGGPGNDQVKRLVPTADGGFAALALSGSFGPREHAPLLLKFGAGGDRPEWQKMYISSGKEWGDDLKPTSDGGYVIAGAMDPCSPFCGRTRATVVKVDSEGAVQWARTFRSVLFNLPNMVATSIVQTADGGYMVAGEIQGGPAGLTDLLVIRLDGSGNFVWASTYGRAGNDTPGQIEATPGGGFIIVGRTDTFGFHPSSLWLLKIHDDGAVD